MSNHAAQLASDVLDVLKTPAGRRLVWAILTESGIYRASMTGNSWTFFREGQRDIGLKLQTWVLDADPDLYAQMVRECRDVEVADEADDKENSNA